MQVSEDFAKLKKCWIGIIYDNVLGMNMDIADSKKDVKNIYFVQNFHGIQYFLSLYKPTESNLIVMGEPKSLHKFFQEIMPTENKTIVPTLLLRRHRLLVQLYYIFLWRIRYTRLFKEIKPPAKAYCFHKGGDIHFYILLGYLSKRGVDIENYITINNSKQKQMENRKRLHMLHQLYQLPQKLLTLLLNIVAGIKPTTPGPFGIYSNLNRVKLVDYRPLSWGLLSKKYHWAYNSDFKNAILIVDDPIQDHIGVNLKKTQENLISFFTPLSNNGIKIHLKPHYGPTYHASSVNSFSGTSFKEQIRILPEYFPVELIMNQYQEVYCFASISSRTPIKGKKYSLANLIEFNSKENKDLFWKLLKDNYSEEITKIEYVNING